MADKPFHSLPPLPAAGCRLPASHSRPPAPVSVCQQTRCCAKNVSQPPGLAGITSAWVTLRYRAHPKESATSALPQFRIVASAAMPNPAKMIAAPIRTIFIGMIRVILSPRNTAGTFAIIIPSVVPVVTMATC